jgi:hypothetical protein
MVKHSLTIEQKSIQNEVRVLYSDNRDTRFINSYNRIILYNDLRNIGWLKINGSHLI